MADKDDKTLLKSLLLKIFYIMGVYISFVISGVFEEKLYKGTYVDSNNKKFRFDQANLALFLNGIISYFISIYFLSGLPVIGDVFRKLINVPKEEKKENPDLKEDLIKVILTTSSIILFNFDDPKEKSGSNNIPLALLLIGYGLIILSLLCDGIVGLKEKIIGHKIHHDPEYNDYNGYLGWEYNKLFSFFFMIFSLASIIFNLIFFNSYETYVLYLSNKELITNLLFYSVFISIGQIFIYILLEKYGPLTLSMVTGIRKILSIALSIILFGKEISLWKFLSLLLGSLVIVWEIYDKVKRHDKKPHTGHVDTLIEDHKNKKAKSN